MHTNSHSSDKYDFVATDKEAQYDVAIPLDPNEKSVDLSDVTSIPPEVGDELIKANIEDLFEDYE
jgi:hypothetical protein